MRFWEIRLACERLVRKPQFQRAFLVLAVLAIVVVNTVHHP